MKLSTLYPSKYLKCADLEGERMKLLIDRVEIESVGQDSSEPDKPVLYFQRQKKSLVLNKTNAGIIADSMGDDTDNWSGSTILLVPSRTSYQGKMVDCIRVEVPAVAAPAPATEADDIGF